MYLNQFSCDHRENIWQATRRRSLLKSVLMTDVWWPLALNCRISLAQIKDTRSPSEEWLNTGKAPLK